MKAASEASEALHAQLSAENADYKKVYEQWNAYRKSSAKWFGTAEQSFARYAYGQG